MLNNLLKNYPISRDSTEQGTSDTSILHDDDLFEEAFPSDIMPEHVCFQIRALLEELQLLGCKQMIFLRRSFHVI
jgi:hypothetical protein